MSYYLLEAPAYSTFGYFADVEKRIEASSNEDAREIATSLGTEKTEKGVEIIWSRSTITEI
jgi:hypothetical protein